MSVFVVAGFHDICGHKAAAGGVDPCQRSAGASLSHVSAFVDLQFSAQHGSQHKTAADEVTHVISKPAFMLPTTATISETNRSKYLDCG